MKKKNLVVIGARSFIGKNIIENFNQEFNIIPVTSKMINLEKKISKKKIIKFIPKKSILIFLAFKTKHKQLSKQNLIENIEILSNFINIIESTKPSKVIFFSSISVYGDNNSYKNLDEESKLSPDNDYGKAKAISELILKDLSRSLKMKLLIIRIPRVYGKYDYISNYGPTKFLNDISLKKNIFIWGDGKERKHFLYIKDLLRNLKTLIYKDITGIYNICPSLSHSFLDLAKLAIKCTNSKSKIFFKKRNGIKSNHIINNNKIIKVKGVKFTHISLAIKDYYSSIKNLYA
ncbi:MAG: hypothetical protein CBC82_07210 [Cellvibrionales bacterium TMED122]|nr:MAG: hypothetical protein CBC82_07210 [Cellvibrionales bacterium TMED122]|tara:strand:- start:4489 stop:5358 length:870 start_codon:yes stop_codon:yes gene_type:complete